MTFTNNFLKVDESLINLIMSVLSEEDGEQVIDNDPDSPTQQTKPEKTMAEFKKGMQPEDQVTDPVVVNPVVGVDNNAIGTQDDQYTNSQNNV